MASVPDKLTPVHHSREHDTHYIPFVSTVLGRGTIRRTGPAIQSRRFDSTTGRGIIGGMIAMADTIEGKLYLTVAEAMERMGCTDGWVRRLIRDGRLAARKFGNRVWMIDAAGIDQAKAALTTRSVGKRHLSQRPAAARAAKAPSKRRRTRRKSR
jgi:excisionase family DNA binding protein